MTEHDLQKLLREMRDEPVPTESLRRVRIAVAARKQRRGNFLTWWRAAFAAVAVACAVLLVLWSRDSEPVPRAPVTVSKAAPQQAEVLPTAPVAVVKPVRRNLSKRAAAVPAKVVEAPGSNVIRIETPDPDVVILLIAD